MYYLYQFYELANGGVVTTFVVLALGSIALEKIVAFKKGEHYRKTLGDMKEHIGVILLTLGSRVLMSLAGFEAESNLVVLFLMFDYLSSIADNFALLGIRSERLERIIEKIKIKQGGN